MKKFIAQYALTGKDGESIRLLVVVNASSIAKVEGLIRDHIKKTVNPDYVPTILDIQGYHEI